MKKRKLLLPIILLFNLYIPLLSFSQSQVQTWDTLSGEKRLMTNSTKFQQVVGKDKTGIYVVREDHRYHIQKYDQDLKFLKEEDITLWINWRTRTLEKVIHFQDSLYLFTSDRFFNHRTLYVSTLDKETLKQNDDERIVTDVRNKYGYEAEFTYTLSKKSLSSLSAAKYRLIENM